MKKLSWVSFEPSWWNSSPEYHDKHPLKYNERVIYLGDIPNSPSHCVVIKTTGECVPMIHTADLRQLSEEET